MDGDQGSTPPRFEDLNEYQLREYGVAKEALYDAVCAAEEKLKAAGFSDLHALSASTQMALGVAASFAYETAKQDDREPNRDWYQHNCMKHFDDLVEVLRPFENGDLNSHPACRLGRSQLDGKPCRSGD